MIPNFVHRRSLLRFHAAIAWLLQITMFLVLGLLVFPSQLLPVMGMALLIALFLLFVAHPVSVFLSLAFSQNNAAGSRAVLTAAEESRPFPQVVTVPDTTGGYPGGALGTREVRTS